MKRPSFLNGACAAGCLALAASIALAVALPAAGSLPLYQFMVPALGLAYILYQMAHSDERTGRITTLSFWTLFAVTAWFAGPPPALYTLLHVGALWLIRSLYFYSSFVTSLLDLGLQLVALAAAVWAYSHTGSAFLAVWCFFLAQAMFGWIPPSLNRRSDPAQARVHNMEDFERARRRAEGAARRLFAR